MAAAACALAPAGAVAASRPSAFVGVNSEVAYLDPSAMPAALDAIAASGAGEIREPFDWFRIERAPGRYDFAATDTLVGEAAARGIRVFPILWHPPVFASSAPGLDPSQGMAPPADPAAMGRFAAVLVGRYGRNGTFWRDWVRAGVIGGFRRPITPMPITAWEVWNEPDFPFFWPSGPDATAYAGLLRAVHGAIKAVDGKAQVVVGGLTRRGLSDSGYLGRLYRAGAAGSFDAVAIHPYTENVAGVLALVRTARATMDVNGGGATPIRVDEVGWATGGRGNALIVGERCQAALAESAVNTLTGQRKALGIVAVDWFMFNDRPPASQRGDIWPFHTGLVRKDGSHKPAFDAFGNAVAGGRPYLDPRSDCRPPTISHRARQRST